MLTPRAGYWVVRRRGLGQDGTDPSIFGTEGGDVSTVGIDPSTLPLDPGNPPLGPISPTPTTTTPASTAPNPFTTLLNQILPGVFKTTEQIAVQQSNPLYHLQPGTYIQQTPTSTIASTAGIPGSVGLSPLTSGLNLSSMMPILLVGVGLVVLMSMGGGRR